MKASLFAPLAAVDASVQILAIRAAAPKNVLLPKAVLDTYIGQLIVAAGIGAPWIIAVGAPTNGVGSFGSYYLNNATGDIYGPKTTGGWGVVKGNLKGPQGPAGSGSGSGSGSSINTGVVTPTSLTPGVDGDFYLNTVTGEFYGPYANLSYGPALFSLSGTAGAAGTSGAGWQVGSVAPVTMTPGAIGDFYLNTTTGDIYGPRSSSGWGTVVGNLKGPAGSGGGSGGTWLFGGSDPVSGAGSDGDFYFNNTTGVVYGPKTGGTWGGGVANFGSAGGSGTPGTVWLSGSGGPDNDNGVNGDFYLNIDNGNVYGPKDAGAWGSVVLNLTGPAGSSGNSFITGGGAPTDDGDDGDLYLDVISGDLYGPKVDGVWGASTGNLVGPAGSNSTNTWLFGTGVPAVGLGSDGDFYYNDVTADVYGPKTAGAWGSIVANFGPATGATGAPGSVWYFGSVVPDNSLGVNGDLYLNTATGDIYGPKSAGIWGVVAGNLTGNDGAAGAPGINGVDGPAGDNGVDGARGSVWRTGTTVPDIGLGLDGDFYIRTTTGEYYGPKTAGAWGAVVGSFSSATPGTINQVLVSNGAGGYGASFTPSLEAKSVSYTWADRPLVGNTTGDRIVITNVGDYPQGWFWNGTRWLPETGVVRYKIQGPITASNVTTFETLFSVALPVGLLTTGSYINGFAALAADQGGLSTPTGAAPAAWRADFTLYDTVLTTSTFLSSKNTTSTYYGLKGFVTFVDNTHTLAYPWGESEAGESASVFVSNLAVANPIEIIIQVQKTTAENLVNLIGGYIEVTP